ncbi:hypothetical protein CONPUDRAFT_139394 [Coniophora puteana RWD-64-598 SS2]|uniref:F-box domain-containing protein n=1 Tax=Coniophora puteana (strain RWD-64-598) TaxID=741705 RepID=A0A5M3MCS3_CONPW|nr:uncharacterized protein CONPUDRAFT_139394 [Coniophora puteana RWD-64-598 SS2]EIW76650.1 hypothetical protein CONPUDRAFT_139394 [Coniophora puteana RWD-64-598 SS2]
MPMVSIEAVPQEIIEHIAFFAGTQYVLGPPSDLLPLLLTSRAFHRQLADSYNPWLYARIFEYKFDLRAAARRLGAEAMTVLVLKAELQKRCAYLKKIKARTSAFLNEDDDDLSDDGVRAELLWMAYLMMLENDGKNERHLREYAQMETWLWDYWFDARGASRASQLVSMDKWLPDTEQNSLAMWLFWLLFDPEQPIRSKASFRIVPVVLKLAALAANRYPICLPSWATFLPQVGPKSRGGNPIEHFSQTYHLKPPPLTSPAILSYLTLAIQYSSDREVMHRAPHTPSKLSASVNSSLEWEADWYRCSSLGQADYSRAHCGAYVPGCMEGIWEGLFTYTEFTAYAALLSGGPPSALQKSLVAQHRQTWRLREYHLMVADTDGRSKRCLATGDPLRGFFPVGTHIRETSGGIEVQQPRTEDALCYQSSSSSPHSPSSDPNHSHWREIADIMIVGEGHSAWGQFNLIGRVRPLDGFITLAKEYTDGERGRWLYRGYLVGNVNGNLSGRWRDTLSPTEVPGYEGCFVMSRRK